MEIPILSAIVIFVLFFENGLGFFTRNLPEKFEDLLLKHPLEQKGVSIKSLEASGLTVHEAMEELRESKRTVAKKGRKKPTAKKPASSARVSYKECNLEAGRRLDCGYYGITEDACARRECCYQETEEEDVPWCYHSLSTIDSKCLMNPEERMECGSYGIRKEQCLARGCCWQPTSQGDVPWCYNELHIPIYAGECGVPAIPPNVHMRIVGGDETVPHSFPWMVSLQLDDFFFCGGSLINSQWVLSAGHCGGVFDWGERKEVVLGMHNQATEEASQVRAAIDQVIIHERYGTSTGFNDIMLLKLEEPVEMADEISPVCLPDPDEEVTAGRRCYTTGWGTLESGGGIPDTLQQVMVPLIETSVCNQPDWYNGEIEDSMVCAGYEEGGRDSCQGDSGGPLVCFENGEWELIGIVSWGYGCAQERKPGVYTKVSYYNEWIQSTIDENS